MRTSQELVAKTFEKFKQAAHLRAVIEENPEAMAIAAACDEAAEPFGPLHGLPVLIKDNINTGDKMRTTAGSVALADNAPAADAPAAANLRAAGAVIVGKANMTEFANYMCDFRLDEKMPNGYSSRGGQTVHPLGAEFDPSGSSTGSAVAVAAGLVSMAVGSETYGSIISPSQLCGIVGIKPTDGLISKEGVIPISFTLDTLGPMTDSVAGAALLLGALSGHTYPMARTPKDITVGVCRAGFTGEKWPPDDDWRGANENMLKTMAAAGMTVKELPPDDADGLAVGRDDSFMFPLMRYEFRHAINSYLAAYGTGALKNLDEIIAYNKAHADTALKYGQGNLIAAAAIAADWQNQAEYVEALAKRAAAKEVLAAYFDKNGVDMVVILSANCAIAAATGFPSMTLPIGKTAKGLPIGCLLLARPFDEDVLLSAGKVIEVRGQKSDKMPVKTG